MGNRGLIWLYGAGTGAQFAFLGYGIPSARDAKADEGVLE